MVLIQETQMFEDVPTVGSHIRQFLRELFGSRLVERLETDLLSLRNDYDQRLHEQSLVISSLRKEKSQLVAKVALYEIALMPLQTRAGAQVVASQSPKKPSFAEEFDFPTKTRWQILQEEHNREIADEEKVQEVTKDPNAG